MPDYLHLSGWDVTLLVVVSVQATILAYLHHPRGKAFMLMLPIPFTVASLSLGARVNVTHLLALLPFLLYTHGVRVLHRTARLPIVASIVLSALGYVAIGAGLAALLGRLSANALETAFWIAAPCIFALAATLFALTRYRVEPGHRTPLPVWTKLPIIAGVVLMLILSKKFLQGFMTAFPMVGVVAAYEARHSLWTLCRSVPVFMMCAVPMYVTAHLAWPRVGLGASLALGWVVYLCLLVPLLRFMWAAERRQEAALLPAAENQGRKT